MKLNLPFVFDGDGGAFGEHDGEWLHIIEWSEGFPIHFFKIDLDNGIGDGVNIPSGVGHFIFEGGVGIDAGIAPIVFGDKLSFAAIEDRLGDFFGGESEGLPQALAFPGVFDLAGLPGFSPPVAHGHGGVMFAVEGIGHEGEGRPRHDLLDKDHAPFPGIAVAVAHVKAEVHLFEIDVKRNGDAQQAGIFKEEAHEADVAGIVPGIEFGLRREEWLEGSGRNSVIGESEVEPLSGEERHKFSFKIEISNRIFYFLERFLFSARPEKRNKKEGGLLSRRPAKASFAARTQTRSYRRSNMGTRGRSLQPSGAPAAKAKAYLQKRISFNRFLNGKLAKAIRRRGCYFFSIQIILFGRGDQAKL